MKNRRPVVLAIDASRSDPKLARRVGRWLRALLGPSRPAVHAAYVLTPDAAAVPGAWFGDVAPRLAYEASGRLESFVQTARLPNASTNVLLDRDGSARGVAERLAAFAAQVGAEAVALPTPHRSAFGRLLTGSCAEALLDRGEVPVLTFGERCADEPPAGRRCIVAVDHEDPLSSALAARASDLAARHGLELVFVHAAPPARHGGIGWDGPAVIDPRSLAVSALPEAERALLAAGDRLARRAEVRGCVAGSRLVLSLLSVPDAILHAARLEGASLVAVATGKGPLARALRRSVAREVARSSPTPVWALRPEVVH